MRAGNQHAALLLLMSAVLTGCSAVPYAPGPTIVPSPSATSAPATTSPAASSEGGLSTPASPGSAIELRGSVISEDGQTATLDVRIGLGGLGPAHRDTAGNQDARRLAIHGTTTLTNPTDRIDVAAASVDLVLQAGYPRSSPACEALPPPDGLTWGAYCWYLLATASALDERGTVVALQPGEQRVRNLTTIADGLGQLRTTDSAARRLGATLRRPAVVVVVTSAVDYNGTRLRGGCRSISTDLTPSSAATQAVQPDSSVVTDHAVVAATKTIACRDLRYIGP